MPSKYCPNCDELISTTSFIPNYCGYCGRDLSDVPLFPEFNTYKERIELLTRLRAGQDIYGRTQIKINEETGQIKLF